MDASGELDPSSRPFLLHWNGTKWAVIKVPALPVGSIWGNVNVTQDGHGGAWLDATTIALSGAQQGYLVHDSGGAWSRTKAPALAGDFTEPGTLAWIPGTRSVWGTGEDSVVQPNLTGSPAVILKYGA